MALRREGQARQAFLNQLHDRMRRVRRGRDKPLAIFEPFGSKADGDFDATEAYLLDNLAKVDQGPAGKRLEVGLLLDRVLARFGRRPLGAECSQFSPRIRQDHAGNQAAGHEARPVDRQRPDRRLDDLGQSGA